jgi:hypothetical protein
MPIETKLVNEYGAGLTPLIEELDALLWPICNELSNWAMGISEMNGRDWAIVRTFALAEFTDEPIGKSPDGININWLARVDDIADRLRDTCRFWLVEHPLAHKWEYAFIWQWAYGTLSCVCAQIQIEKAMKQRRTQQEIWQGGTGWQKIS